VAWLGSSHKTGANQKENFALNVQPFSNPCSAISANRAVVNGFYASASPWTTCVQCGGVELYNSKEQTCSACKSQYQYKTFDCKSNCVSFDQFQASFPPFTIEKIAFLYHDSVNLQKNADTNIFGEYRVLDDETKDESDKCLFCNSCDYMHIDYSLTDFESIKDETYQQILKSYFRTPDIIDRFASERMGYQNSIIYEDVQNSPRFGFRKLKASCLPIPEKKILWDGPLESYSPADTSTWSNADYADLIKFDGENYYKSIYAALNHDHKLFALKLMKPYFINAKSTIDDQTNCQVRHCSHICNGVTVEEQANYPILHLIAVSKNVYMYARGCSPSTVFDVILKKTLNGELITSKLLDVLKQTTTKAEIETWDILHSGECVRCKDCGNGQYNPYCNKYGYLDDSSQLILPEGKCFMCLNTCPDGNYLSHPLRYAGCERFAIPELFDNVHNYKCKKCPTLIFIDAPRTATSSNLHPNPLPAFPGLYVVAGCGENSDYEHFETSVTGTHFYTSCAQNTYTSNTGTANGAANNASLFPRLARAAPACPGLTQRAS